MRQENNNAEQLLAEMKNKWRERIPGVIERKNVRHSSVLVPLIEIDGKLEVLFEVRSSKLHRQPGEVCFPGGAVEDGENYEETAIRETMEELLIGREQIEVVAPLDYLETSSGLTVRAYLGILKNYEQTYSADEVERIFTVPLAWLLEHDPERYVAAVHTIPGDDFPYQLVPGGREYHWHEGQHTVYFYQYGQEIIWGMTAKIMYAFIKLCRGERL